MKKIQITIPNPEILEEIDGIVRFPIISDIRGVDSIFDEFAGLGDSLIIHSL